MVAWQLFERVVRRPLVIGFVGGTKLRCYPHSASASGVLYCRLPEWREMRFVLDFLHPGDVFIDVGANIGVYSLLAASVGSVDVWAFEPSSEAARRARENIALNNLEAHVRLRQEALGSVAGEGRLTLGLDTVNRLVTDNHGAAEEPVRVATLDAVLPSVEAGRTSLVKIDVEGAEVDVLRGSTELLSRHKAVFIVENNRPEDLDRLFQAAGYCAYEYEPDARSLHKISGATTRNLNIIFVPDADLVSARLRQSVA